MTDDSASEAKRSVRGSLAASVHREIKAEIIRCRLPPGSMLAAHQVAERFDVSRAPVHEAFKVLCQEGFLRVLPRVGYIVTPVTPNDIDEIFDLRLELEVFGAGRAATLATDEDVESLRAQHARALENHDTGSIGDAAHIESLIAGNREFHTMIADLSGNGRLARMVGALLDEGQRIYFMYFRASRPPPASDTHEDIISALADRDPDAARRAMAAHIQDTREGTHIGSGSF